MHIRYGNIVGIANLERQCESPFTSLLFCLQRVELPVGPVLQHHFISHVVLARQFVNSTFSRSVRDIKTGLGKRTGRPNIDERPAPAIGYPEAGVLAVPAAREIRVCSVS